MSIIRSHGGETMLSAVCKIFVLDAWSQQPLVKPISGQRSSFKEQQLTAVNAPIPSSKYSSTFPLLWEP
jgi:hypothetical protein